MKNITGAFIPLLLFLTCFACGQASSIQNNKQQIKQAGKDGCDDRDADISCCFNNMPAALSNTLSIANADETVEKLIIKGTVFKADGEAPYPNVILYAYHTDSKGIYSKDGTESGVQKAHGRLHGWCKTDKDGLYEIQTTRPASYPGSTIPAHIHTAVKTGEGQMFWISDFVFKDDPFVDEKYLASLRSSGGTGVVDIKKDQQNVWTGNRDIVLKQ